MLFVVLVVLFYIWPNIFTYAYLGVDLFFLLYIYLITKIIYTKLHEDKFSFKEYFTKKKDCYQKKQIFAYIDQLFKNYSVGNNFYYLIEAPELGFNPKNMYYDSKYCYAIKNGKMLYADDDHHSVDGSIMQAKYFEKKIFNDKSI